MDIRDSSTYRAIFDEGRIQEAQKLILRQGQRKFDSPSDAITAAILAVSDLEHLHRIQDQISTTSTWDELLATP